MRTSGNGQHRRPRQAPKFVVTVGATGAGIAIPLLSAVTAHAATVSTWDKVADCQTGGQWSANDGSGFFGGLNLTASVWHKYGGKEFAHRPDLASRQQQITVAENVLNAEGPEYWASCAVSAGLEQGQPGPDVNPGTDPTLNGTTPGTGLLGLLLGGAPAPAAASPGTPAGPAAPSAAPGAAASPGSATAPAAGPSAAPAPGATAPAAPGIPAVPPAASAPGTDPAAAGGTGSVPGLPFTGSTGRHAGPPAAGEAGLLGAEQAVGTGTAVPAGRGAHARPSAPEPDSAQAGPYTVLPGDSLAGIAAKYAVPGGWPRLYDANRSTVGADPGLIHPGQRIALAADQGVPAAPAG